MTSPTSCPPTESDSGRSDRVRLDRWLWAARFFKTRALAKAAVEGGRVLLLPALSRAGAPVADGALKPKPSREIVPGDRLLIRRGSMSQTVQVLAVDARRGSATVAARLFAETPESLEARALARARQQLERAGLQVPAGRPDRRERRERMKLKQSDHSDSAAPDAPPA
jgi:ribosome-associated heat shock protein Hsp15